MDPDRYKFVQVTQQGRITICTLNRPDALNAINVEVHAELEELFHDLAGEESTNAIVLTGAGRAFCAGGDIRSMADGELTRDKRPGGLFTRGAERIIRNLLTIKQPIVAALNGDAIGLGATLALFCDVVIAAEGARIGDPHVRVGLVAGDGGAVIWPMLIGVNRAKEYLLTGKLIGATEAAQIGLINHAVPADQLMSEAMAMAERLANGPTWAIRWTKQAVNKALWDRVNLIQDMAVALEALSAATQDHQEAVASFVERRPPNFTGI
jgi:enoyl-CoA hydratase